MISQIVPVFLLIAFGYLLTLLKIADQSWVRILNKYGLYVGFPFLIFGSLIVVDREVLRQQVPTFFTSIALICLFISLIYLIVRKLKVSKELSVSFLIGGFNGNTGYLGFPLIIALYPEAGATIGLVISTYTLSLFTLGLLLLESLSGEKKDLREITHSIVTNPLLIAAVAGLAVVLFDITLPGMFLQTVDMLKASASPVVLIGLGIFMHHKINYRGIAKPLALLLFVKMILFPLVYILAGRLGSLDQTFDIAILEASMPMAITNFALSDRYPVDKELMVSAIIISTLITPVLFPLYVSLL